MLHSGFVDIAIESYEVARSKGFRFTRDYHPQLLKEIIGEMYEADEHLKTLGEGAWLKNVEGYSDIIAMSPDDVTKEFYEISLSHTANFELADVCLRHLSLLGSLGVFDSLNYNVCNSNVRSFDELLLRVARLVSGCVGLEDVFVAKTLLKSLSFVVSWCDKMDLDLDWCIRTKLLQNKKRPYLHRVS